MCYRFINKEITSPLLTPLVQPIFGLGAYIDESWGSTGGTIED